MKKKILSLALALVLIIALVPAASASDTQTISKDTFTLTNVIRVLEETDESRVGLCAMKYYLVSEGAVLTFDRTPKMAQSSYISSDLWSDWDYEDFYANDYPSISDKEEHLDDNNRIVLEANKVYDFGLLYDYDWGNMDYAVVVFVVDNETAAKISSTTSTDPTDVPSTWAVPEVNAAIEAGLVPENLQKNYQTNVTRGAVANMFINLIEQASGMSIDEFMVKKGVEIDPDAFNDTNDPAVLAANALGIIRGLGDGRFDPDGTLLRAQIAAVICRVAHVLDVDTDGYTHTFEDTIGHWVETEIGWPIHAKIINGVGNNKFDPNGTLTTEQAIAITYRALTALS